MLHINKIKYTDADYIAYNNWDMLSSDGSPPGAWKANVNGLINNWNSTLTFLGDPYSGVGGVWSGVKTAYGAAVNIVKNPLSNYAPYNNDPFQQMEAGYTFMWGVTFSQVTTGFTGTAFGSLKNAITMPKFGKWLGGLRIPIYRVYGGNASMYGKSYSLINPKYIPFYRNFAGLPKVNSGQYLLKGSIPLRDIKIGRWFAAPLDGNTGGLPFELYQNYNQLINPINIINKKPF